MTIPESDKTLIRCMLLTSPNGVDMRQFLKEYEETQGFPVPFEEYGYKSPLELLSSMPDSVKVLKNKGQTILYPVVNEAISHINKLVTEQKSSHKRKPIRKLKPYQLPSGRNDTWIASQPSRITRPPPGFSSPPGFPQRGWECQPCPPRRPLTNGFSETSFNNEPHHIPIYALPSNLRGDNQHLQSSPHISSPAEPLTWRNNHKQHSTHQSDITNLIHEALTQQTPVSQGKSEPYPNDMLLLEPKMEENVSSPQGKPDLPREQNSAAGLVSYQSSEEESEGTEIRSQRSEGKNLCRSGKAQAVDHSSEDKDTKFQDKDALEYSYSENEELDSYEFSDRMKENFRTILREHPYGVLATKFHQLYLEKFKAPLNHFDLGFRSIHEMAMACPDVFSVYSTKTGRGLPNWLFFDVHSKAVSEDSSKWIPRPVLENMLQLSLMYPNGLASEDVPKAYKNKFKVPLDVKKLGFETVNSFLMNCPSIVYAIMDDKALIFPENWGNNEDPEEDYTNLSVENADFLWKDIFNPLVCNPAFKFKKFKITESDKSLLIKVADVVSPDVLWLQNLDSKVELNNLMESLNNFYTENGQNFLMTESMIVPGLPCCAMFMNQWHRALVCQPSGKKVKVFYLDYGTTEDADLQDLRTLHNKFGDLPTLAIKAKLHGISPCNSNGWTTEGIEFLYDLCLDQEFQAEIVGGRFQIPSIDVILYSCAEDSDGISVNNLMIDKGFAASINKQKKNDFVEDPLPGNVNTDSKNNDDLSSFPENFLSLLPFWMNVTNDWKDTKIILQEAKEAILHPKTPTECMEMGSNDLNYPSCCTHHLFSFFFKTQPAMFCDVWRETLESFIDDIQKHLLHNLSLHMNTSVKLETLKRFCHIEDSEEAWSKHESKIYLSRYSLDEQKLEAAGIASSTLNVGELAHRCSFDSEALDTNSVSNEFNFVIQPIESPTFRESSSLNVSTEYLDMSLEPSGLQLVFTSVNDKWFNFLRLDAGVYMFRDELLAKLSANELFKMKIFKLQPCYRKCYVISPKCNKPIYTRLVEKRIIKEGSRISAIPLSIVDGLLESILPKHEKAIEYIKEFGKMSGTYPADDPFWFDGVDDDFEDQLLVG